MRKTAFALAALGPMLLAGCAGGQAPASTLPVAAPAPVSALAPAAIAPGERPAPDTMRWLYGSGEAAGASIQAYRMLADYAIAEAKTAPAQSVMMGLPGAEGGVSAVSCRNADGSRKAPAVVFDADETVILNSGFEYWQATHDGAYDAKVWERWEREGARFAAPVPGAVTGLRRLREAGITPVFNTNRASSTADGTVAALAAAGLGDAAHGETLFLRGDDATGSAKDGRRAMIAARYCVIALAGDNLGDFADMLNDSALGVQQRRTLTARGEIAQLWGNGWFMLPNPVYGASIRGTIDEVFPPEARWSPDAPPPKP